MPHPLRLAESQVTRLACELRTNLHATFKTRNTPLSLRRANACCIIASPFINTRCCCSNLATETKAGDKKLSPTCQCRWRACAPHAPENGYRQSFSKTSLQIRSPPNLGHISIYPMGLAVYKYSNNCTLGCTQQPQSLRRGPVIYDTRPENAEF